MNFTSAYLTSLLVSLVAPMTLFGQYDDPTTTDESEIQSSVQSDDGNRRVGQRHVGSDGREYEWQLIPVAPGTRTSNRAPINRGVVSDYGTTNMRSFPMGAPAYSTPAPTYSAPIVSAPVVSAPVVSAPVVSAPVVSAPIVSAPVVSAPAPVIQQTRVVYVPRPVVVPRPVFIQPAPVFFQPAPTVFIAPQPRRKKHSCLFRH